MNSIKWSEKTLKFNCAEVNKKRFYASKQPNALNSLLIKKIVLSGKFKRSDKDFMNFVDYKENDIIKYLCIIFPQMSPYI